MILEPSTPEEEEQLHQMLINAEPYNIKLDVIAMALDKDLITRRAIEHVEASRVDDENMRRHLIEAIRSDLAEAIGILLDASGIFAREDGIYCRSASFHIERQDPESS